MECVGGACSLAQVMCKEGGMDETCLDSFSQLFNPAGFEEANIRKFVAQTLEGLQYLHHNLTHHGALSCDNILIDSSGTYRYP